MGGGAAGRCGARSYKRGSISTLVDGWILPRAELAGTCILKQKRGQQCCNHMHQVIRTPSVTLAFLATAAMVIRAQSPSTPAQVQDHSKAAVHGDSRPQAGAHGAASQD